MKKDKLIALLQTIDGNPDIKFWNPLVEDWMDIDLDTEVLHFVKETKEHLYNILSFEWMRDNNTFEIPDDIQEKIKKHADSLHKNKEFDLPNRYVNEQEFQNWYGTRKKKVCLLYATPRGKKSFDRFKGIRY